MEFEEAREHIGQIRKERHELSLPLRNSEATQEQKQGAMGDLRAFRELLRNDDPDYREALRAIAEARKELGLENPEADGNLVPDSPEKPERIEYDFPTDPEERFAAVMSSIGNGAQKCVTLLELSQTRGILTSTELRNAFLKDTQGIWRVSKSVPSLYMRNTLIPIGFVAEEVVMRSQVGEYTVGFSLTDSGRKYGVPIAKFLTRESSKFTFSLSQVFGATSSNGETRAPYTRAQILEELFRSSNMSIRFIDLAKILRVSPTIISKGLKVLEKFGFVVQDSVDIENTKGKFLYSFNTLFEGTRPKIERSQPLTNAIIKVLQELSSGKKERFFEAREILEKVQESGGYGKENILQGLSSLERQGFLKTGEFKGERLSSVFIMPEGEEFVENILLPIRKALADTPEGEALREEWNGIPWKDYAQKAVGIHKDSSRHINSEQIDEAVKKVFGIVQENPGIRSMEVGALIGSKSPGRSLNSLLKEGRVRKEKVGKATRWYVVEEGNGGETRSESSKFRVHRF
jgi:DNA-binding MarR family transcriptional regulator